MRLQCVSIAPPLLLNAEVSGSDLKITWPLWAQDFELETTTDLGNPDGWMPMADTPAIVDSESAVTIPASDENRFYRLKQ